MSTILLRICTFVYFEGMYQRHMLLLNKNNRR
jgi:hypothetical protein